LKLSVAGLAVGLLGVAVGAANAADDDAFKILKLEGNLVRWQQGAGPVGISYSLATAEVTFPRARNCRKLTSVNGLLAASRIPAQAAREEIAAAFAMWEAAANIKFHEAATPEEADILIGAQVQPEGWAFADVFYDAFSVEAIKPISKSLICLNPTRAWKIGFNGDLKTYDLRYTLAHEIGHAIGLDHPAGAGQIMGYRYEERFRALQPGDITGAVVLYGKHVADGEQVASSPAPAEAARASAARPSTERWGSRAFTPPSK
jgi:hypothetical protein